MRLISSARSRLAKIVRHESERAFSRLRFVDDLRPGNVTGHEVGRELNALERQIQNLRQAADQQCLGQARNADHQHMTLDREGHEEVANGFFLADDALAKLLGEAGIAAWDAAKDFHIGVRGGLGGVRAGVVMRMKKT